MKNIQSFEEFTSINEGSLSSKKVEIARLNKGRVVEKIEGTIDNIVKRYSSAIEDLLDSGSGKLYSNEPKSLEELLNLLNNAQAYAERKDVGKTNITYVEWDKA